jgi:DNA polymerase-4
MGTQHAFGLRARPPEQMDAILVALVDRLAGRLRAARRVCRTVTLRFRFADFARATRSQTLSEATAHTSVILATGRELLAAAMPMLKRRGITMLGISLTNLSGDDAIQLALPLERQRAGALDSALDNVRDRFGSGAIKRAVLIGREERPSVPLLPD